MFEIGILSITIKYFHILTCYLKLFAIGCVLNLVFVTEWIYSQIKTSFLQKTLPAKIKSIEFIH